MDGLTIWEGFVISSSSVVIRNFQQYEIYECVPAQLRHKRCPDSVIGQLLKICWWTWPFDRIRRNARFFSADLGHLEVSLASLVTP
jgi:virginiamycin A acetyltransferase